MHASTATSGGGRHGLRRGLAVGAVVVLILSVTVAGAAPAPAARDAYASPDAPGPRLTVSESELRRSLTCSGDLGSASREPVLFVPAGASPEEHYGWNYHRALDALDWPYCSVALPEFGGLGEDMQVSAEYVVHGIRTMYERSGRRIGLLGASLGAALSRWALRFWPDIRAMVEDRIGLGPPNRGAQATLVFCLPGSTSLRTATPTPLPPTTGCNPPIWQLLPGSMFVRAMNSHQETFPGISYSEITSHQDLSTTASDTRLDGGGGRVRNVAVQDVCPPHIALHDQLVSYDPVAYALAIDALTHDGPADPARIDPSVCSRSFAPGVDPATFPLDFAKFEATYSKFAMADRVPEEPALRCYVAATCPRDRR